MRFRLPLLAVLLTVLGLAGCSGTRYADAPPLAFEAIDYGFDVSYALDDPRLAYIDVGEGDETILLVHGLASNAGFWRYTIQASPTPATASSPSICRASGSRRRGRTRTT